MGDLTLELLGDESCMRSALNISLLNDQDMLGPGIGNIRRRLSTWGSKKLKVQSSIEFKRQHGILRKADAIIRNLCPDYDSELETIDAVGNVEIQYEVDHSDAYGGDSGNILCMEKKKRRGRNETTRTKEGAIQNVSSASDSSPVRVGGILLV